MLPNCRTICYLICFKANCVFHPCIFGTLAKLSRNVWVNSPYCDTNTNDYLWSLRSYCKACSCIHGHQRSQISVLWMQQCIWVLAIIFLFIWNGHVLIFNCWNSKRFPSTPLTSIPLLWSPFISAKPLSPCVHTQSELIDLNYLRERINHVQHMKDKWAVLHLHHVPISVQWACPI